MNLAIASLSLLLVACTGPQSPAGPEAPAAPAPAATPAAPATDAPMAKRAPGQEDTAPLQVFRAFGNEPFWNVNVEDATLTFTTPEDQAGVVMQGTRRALETGVELSGQPRRQGLRADRHRRRLQRRHVRQRIHDGLDLPLRRP